MDPSTMSFEQVSQMVAKGMDQNMRTMWWLLLVWSWGRTTGITDLDGQIVVLYICDFFPIFPRGIILTLDGQNMSISLHGIVNLDHFGWSIVLDGKTIWAPRTERRQVCH